VNATNDGGPAFPVASDIYNGSGLCGMSLRDWFAGQALAGMLSSEHRPDGNKLKADWAYELADAMLRAREGSQIANPTDELPDEHWHKIQTRPSLSWHPTREWEAACEMRGKMMYGRGKTIAAAQAALRAEWEGGAQ